jgi:hypothetical protein
VLLIAIAAVVLLVTDYILDRTSAISATAAIVTVFVVLWYGLPLYGYLRRGAG